MGRLSSPGHYKTCLLSPQNDQDWELHLALCRSSFPGQGRQRKCGSEPRGFTSPRRSVPWAQPAPGAGDKARTWTGASDCSFEGAPPRSGVASASPPGPPSPRTCGRPRRARAPPPPPLRLPREPETPHPPSPTAGSPLPRQPSHLRPTAAGVGSGQDLRYLCRQDRVPRTAATVTWRPQGRRSPRQPDPASLTPSLPF